MRLGGHVYRLPVNAIRIFNAYGTRSKTSGAYGAVFGVFLAQKLAGKPFTVVGDGTQRRDFLFVTDVARGFYHAAITDRVNEIFNLGAGNPQPVNRLIELLGGPVIHLPKRPGEPDCTWADISKIQSDLGWKQRVSFEDGVAEMILSRPLDRWRWLGAQGCWVLIASGLVAAGGTIGGFLATRSLAALSDVHISSLVIVGAGGWLLTATIGMFALLIASAVRTGARVVGLVAGATLVAYAVNYLSVIWGVIRPFGRLSPFHYYDPTRILGNGSMPWSSVATLLAAALVLGLAALISVQRREFSP